jgi:hypothetical protein
VLLGVVHPAAEPKRLLLALLRARAVATRLDAAAFEISSAAQRWITGYLASAPEDPSLLFRESGTLRTLRSPTRSASPTIRATSASP